MGDKVTRERTLELIDEQIRIYDLSEFHVLGVSPRLEGWKTIRALIEHGPEVSRGFIEEKIKYLAEHLSQHRLEMVLIEAGVEVTG